MTRTTRRIEQILSEMRIEEKVAQLCSIWLVIQEGGLSVRSLRGTVHTESEQDPFQQLALGIGQITRPLGSAPVSPTEGVRTLNRIQRFLVENTRLGIPALPHEECLSGLMVDGATIFPSAPNLGSLWDPDLVREIGRAIGDELTSVGSRQGLAPVLDVCRDARWGRNEECYGEDPYLVGATGTAYVQGLQGPDGRALATLKHYLGHSFSEGGRNHAPVRIGERELRDVFLLPFEMAIHLGRAGAVMPAYHDIDGEPLHQSRYYLTDVLRGELGFGGLVVADYEGIPQLASDHGTQPDIAGAAAAALNAGIDVDLPSDSAFRDGIIRALERGDLDGAVVDAAVKRVLVHKFRLGLFDNPYAREDAVELNTAPRRELARRAAIQSIVLLTNDGTLPLAPKHSIAVVGPLADDKMSMLNGYSFPVHLLTTGADGHGPEVATIVDELRKRTHAGITHERGCDILTERPKDAPVFPGEIGLDGTSQRTTISGDTSGIAAAVAAAGKADRAVVTVGDLSGLFLTGTVGEGSDVASLRLPGVQQELIDAVLDTGTPTVVVVASGRPYDLGRATTEAAAIVQVWLPGQEGAAAIASILYGEAVPGGKLSISIPKRAGALPYFYNHKFKSPGTPIQGEFGASFPFGHGLSYTTFELIDVSMGPTTVASDGEIVVECTVVNCGDRDGDEVVQVYVRDLVASLVRPVMELKGFRRVHVRAGDRARIRIEIPTDLLSFTGSDGRRVLEPGDFEVLLGTSSRAIAERTRVHVSGPPRILKNAWRMESRSEVVTS